MFFLPVTLTIEKEDVTDVKNFYPIRPFYIYYLFDCILYILVIKKFLSLIIMKVYRYDSSYSLDRQNKILKISVDVILFVYDFNVCLVIRRIPILSLFLLFDLFDSESISKVGQESLHTSNWLFESRTTVLLNRNL